MSPLALLKEALRILEACGYTIRQECLEGTPGGACALRGQKLLLLDIRLSPQEQLEVVLKVLAEEPKLSELGISANLAELIEACRSSR
jgi:hypothetical protein